MKPKNCWEVLGCDCQPVSDNRAASGACPATLMSEYDGVNEGNRGGRFCWAIAGTMCRGETQGICARKLMDCLSCDFFQRVQEEEGRFFVLAPGDLKQNKA